jgi:hypothetical protein
MCSVEQLTRSQSTVYTTSLNCSCVGLMQYRMVCTKQTTHKGILYHHVAGRNHTIGDIIVGTFP